jgi:thiol-disulfide isomerase/thioredoxin
MKLKLIGVLFLICGYSAVFAGKTVELQAKYRAVLFTPGGELPFELELKIDSIGKGIFTVMNGEEHISNTFKYNPNDSFDLAFPVFDTYMRVVFKDKKLESMDGLWYDRSRTGNYYLKFHAELYDKFRFIKTPLSPLENITGKYATTFSDESSKDETVGIFKQEGSHLSATFLTTTGDYRFLEGEVSADSFYLSAFDGSHAFLFKGKIQDDKTLTGNWWSGKHYSASFIAQRNENANLPDPKSLTYIKDSNSKFEFAFADENGKMVSLNDEQFKNKVIIVLITGTWCPNCMDETSYMSEVEEKYKDADLEIIALSFERKPDAQTFKSNIEKERLFFGIDYTILNAGLPKDATSVLPMLNKVMGFPTTIILNKQHEVVEIYTGFSGPATGEIFVEFRKNFEELIDKLLN